MKHVILISICLIAFAACGGSGSNAGGDGGIDWGYGAASGDVYSNAAIQAGGIAFEDYWEDGSLQAKGYRLQQGDAFVLIGPYQSFYENGQLASEGNFILGKMYGPWHFWYENGVQRLDGFYVDSKLDRSRFWVERDDAGTLVNASPNAAQIAAAEPSL